MEELKSSGKPFDISKAEVWDAWIKVKGNQGAPGVDGQSLAAFEKDLKNNLYRIWNRMSSGTYFPPPVKAVEIPKAHGVGTRILGVPPLAIGWPRRWWPRIWGHGWNQCSIRTLTAIGRSGRHWMRSEPAGIVAGSTTG